MKKKKVILSFDYELFFGDRSGTVLKTIIEPTYIIMKLLEQNEFRGNFFVDYLMLRELEKLSDERALSDLKLLKEQIKDMVSRGHRIELHLHPHWIDAKYSGDGIWDFTNYTHYSLSSLDEETIVSLFKEGTEYLTLLAKEVEPDYKIVAFRAGGWAVQPFANLKRGFIESGIQIDSSVSSGLYGKNQYSYFDFYDAPIDEYWHFEDDVCTKCNSGRFIEVPISSFNRNLIYRIVDYIYRKFSNKLKPITDGTHKRNDLINEIPPRKIKSLMTISRLSTFSVILAAITFKKSLVTYIDHPKDFSPSFIRSIFMLSFLYNSICYKDLIDR